MAKPLVAKRARPAGGMIRGLEAVNFPKLMRVGTSCGYILRGLRDPARRERLVLHAS